MEILIAVSIIAVLSIIGITSYSSINKRSRDAKRKSDLEQVRAALEMYRADKGNYPPVNVSGYDKIDLLSSTLVDGGFLPSLPTDPQSVNLYRYEATNYDAVSDSYYGYCLCAKVEIPAETKTECTDLPAECNYSVRNP